MRTWHLLLDQTELPEWDGSSPLDEHLIDVVTTAGASPGDVLVSVLPDTLTAEVERTFTGCDHVLHRTPDVTDIYRCGFADQLLHRIGCSPAHHTQVRRFTVEGEKTLQVAIYPRPPATHGVRLWCDPALVWMFVNAEHSSRAMAGLARVQPSWERLRAHHAPPMDCPPNQRLARRYPVEDPLPCITEGEWRELQVAVDKLVGQANVRDIEEGLVTPRAAVDSTLRQRRALSRHMDRLDKVLYHSHGPAEMKLQLLAETMAAALTRTGDEDRNHLLAPHEHLVMGLRETHGQVAGAVSGASTTAGLISSTALSRLLDRSEANRRATTAVAAAAFCIAVLTGYSALAAIPAEDRAVRDIARLAGWVGAGGILLVAFAYSLARVAAAPATSAPGWVRRAGTPFTVVSAIGALVLFVAGALSGRLLFTACAGVLVVGLMFVRAWTDDY